MYFAITTATCNWLCWLDTICWNIHEKARTGLTQLNQQLGGWHTVSDSLAQSQVKTDSEIVSQVSLTSLGNSIIQKLFSNIPSQRGMNTCSACTPLDWGCHCRLPEVIKNEHFDCSTSHICSLLPSPSKTGKVAISSSHLAVFHWFLPSCTIASSFHGWLQIMYILYSWKKIHMHI